MTVLEGEAVALLEALHFADANRWDRVVFKSDSSTLVQALLSQGHSDSEFYAIVSSIIYQLSLHSNFKVKFVRRQANMVAHILARAACSWASHRIFGSYPSCIEHWLINDNSYICFVKKNSNFLLKNINYLLKSYTFNIKYTSFKTNLPF